MLRRTRFRDADSWGWGRQRPPRLQRPSLPSIRGIRELHWHPNADEWQYYISGTGRMTCLPPEPRTHHGLSSRGCWLRPEDAAALCSEYGRHRSEISGDVQEQRLSGSCALGMLTHTPPLELVLAHLGIDKATLDAMPKDEVVVMPK